MDEDTEGPPPILQLAYAALLLMCAIGLVILLNIWVPRALLAAYDLVRE